MSLKHKYSALYKIKLLLLYYYGCLSFRNINSYLRAFSAAQLVDLATSKNVGSVPRGHKSGYVQYTCLPSKCIWINEYSKWINSLQGTSITSLDKKKRTGRNSLYSKAKALYIEVADDSLIKLAFHPHSSEPQKV